VLVRFSIGLLLALALECGVDAPDSSVGAVLSIAGQCFGNRYKSLGLVDEAVDLLLNGNGELGAVRCLESVGGLDFLRVAGLVFGSEEGVDGVRAHDVRVGGAAVVVCVEYGWWRVLPVHDCAEGRGDDSDIVGFVKGCLGSFGWVAAKCWWRWYGEECGAWWVG
jgi:hypothetical protein